MFALDARSGFSETLFPVKMRMPFNSSVVTAQPRTQTEFIWRTRRIGK